MKWLSKSKRQRQIFVIRQQHIPMPDILILEQTLPKIHKLEPSLYA